MLALWLLLALGAIHCSAIPKRIWSFWHDSESVPKLVRLAMATWHHFAPDYEVTMLDLRSFAAHLESAQRLGPEDFSNMVFFADWLRLALLESHGGVWLDATLLLTAPLHFLVNDSARLSGVQLEASLFETFLIAVSSPHDVFIQRWKDTLREIFSLSESSYDQHLTQLRGRGIEPLNGAMANCDWSHASPIHSAAHALLHLFARAVNSLAAFTHYYLHPCGQRYWMHYLKTNVVFNSIIGTHGGNVLELYKKWGFLPVAGPFLAPCIYQAHRQCRGSVCEVFHGTRRKARAIDSTMFYFHVFQIKPPARSFLMSHVAARAAKRCKDTSCWRFLYIYFPIDN
ncbi:unnamed protein product [Durusdinium trenchii]|uniref:Uncharacterized protein n=1 Tax=Durusdinium trenchii TaxID=1381693 RepID=A0ABP0NK56_9DINO